MSASDGRSAGDQAGGHGEPASPGGIPPSFGAFSSSSSSSSSPPPSPSPGQPAAGPFASPSTAARRRLPGLGLPRSAKPAGTAGGARSWGSGRGTLTNVLLFGAGPLALAGIIVAAFVLVGPARGGSSNAGFQAGPAPSTQQAAPIATVSPSRPRRPRLTRGSTRTLPVVPRARTRRRPGPARAPSPRPATRRAR